jgi:hypothetical protein
MRAAAWGVVGLLAVLAGGCALDAEEPASDSLDETAATVSDMAVERQWVLKSDGLTEGAETLGVSFTLPGNYKYARVAVDDGPSQVITKGADGRFAAELPVAALEAGVHEVRVASKTSRRALGSATFNVSAPLYVVVSTDWDDTRMSDAFLARIEGLRLQHPGLRYSHFFAPFHYTDPLVTSARKQQIDTWIKRQRDDFGDELGVHIHGWCHFVNTTGVGCKTAETFHEDDGTGYTTILAAYGQGEMETLLQASKDMFAAHDLGTPTSFRAGGWTADAGTLRALANTGFSVDSSAVPASHLAVWKGFELFDWTTAHWEGITETTQPYFPLASNVTQPDPARGISLLEVPDNGVLVDYVTAEEMRAIYEMNHDGGTLDTSTLYQVGFHPPNFSSDFMARMDSALDLVDQHLFEKDAGPAVYVNISELTRVWK